MRNFIYYSEFRIPHSSLFLTQPFLRGFFDHMHGNFIALHFVGSPGDTKPEREVLERVIQDVNDGVLCADKRVNIRLVRWERHAWPGFGDDAQDVVNRIIPKFDLFICIFRGRLGTPTRRADSGTVEEFERAYKAWCEDKTTRLMLYFSNAAIKLDSLQEHDEYRRVLVVDTGRGCSGP